MKKQTLLFLFLLLTLTSLSSCGVSDKNSSTSIDSKKGIIWFYPMAGTDNYSSPRAGKSNLVLFKAGQNYWYKDDNGKVLWFYPQGDKLYPPREGDKQVWCHKSGPNFYCPK